MDRLINADELKKAIGSYVVDEAKLNFNALYENKDLLRVFELVTAMPAVDAEPVRHGRWIMNDNGTYSCSECHSWIPNEQHYYARYCLFCGAKMDGEE